MLAYTREGVPFVSSSAQSMQRRPAWHPMCTCVLGSCGLLLAYYTLHTAIRSITLISFGTTAIKYSCPVCIDVFFALACQTSDLQGWDPSIYMIVVVVRPAITSSRLWCALLNNFKPLRIMHLASRLLQQWQNLTLKLSKSLKKHIKHKIKLILETKDKGLMNPPYLSLNHIRRAL